MRYLLVTYVGKPKGHMDEVVGVSNRLRARDLQTCSVIVDFSNKTVEKCSIGDQFGVREFQTIRDFYHKHYPRVIEDLERANEKSNLVG
jgi:hypothetical protein